MLCSMGGVLFVYKILTLLDIVCTPMIKLFLINYDGKRILMVLLVTVFHSLICFLEQVPNLDFDLFISFICQPCISTEIDVGSCLKLCK